MLYEMLTGRQCFDVPVTLAPDFDFRQGRGLFKTPAFTNPNAFSYLVNKDSKRFLIEHRVGVSEAPPVTVVTNWLSLRK